MMLTGVAPPIPPKFFKVQSVIGHCACPLAIHPIASSKVVRLGKCRQSPTVWEAPLRLNTGSK
jgi:hypothetical protein